MTYSLNHAASPLLEPTRLWRADEIAADPGLVPARPGVYGWWFDKALVNVPMDGALEREGMSLLYVGIARAAPGRKGKASKRTLRDRLKNHTRGPISTSTLRTTLCALAGPSLGLVVLHEPMRKPFLSATHEAELTSWISSHAGVAWMETEEPWLLEKQLISGGPRLPLNIKGSADPFRSTLSSLRAALRPPKLGQ